MKLSDNKLLKLFVACHCREHYSDATFRLTIDSRNVRWWKRPGFLGYKPGSGLPLLSARPAAIPPSQYHCPVAESILLDDRSTQLLVACSRSPRAAAQS